MGGAAAGGGAGLSAGGRGGAAARLRAASDGAGIHTREVDTMTELQGGAHRNNGAETSGQPKLKTQNHPVVCGADLVVAKLREMSHDSLARIS